MTEQVVIDTLHEHWLLFKQHHPVGAYLPVGQLDGDCRCGRGAWPCETVVAVLKPLLAEVWDQGMATGSSRAMRRMSDEPDLPLASVADNPHGTQHRQHLPVDCWCGQSRGTR